MSGLREKGRGAPEAARIGMVAAAVGGGKLELATAVSHGKPGGRRFGGQAPKWRNVCLAVGAIIYA